MTAPTLLSDATLGLLGAAHVQSPNLGQLHAALGLHDADPTHDPSATRHGLTMADGKRLAVWQFEPPAGRRARAVAVIAPATGVPQRFYRPFARWLTHRGYAVFTLDYRGLGESRCDGGGTAGTSMRDWMLGDLPTVLTLARARARQGDAPLPLLWVGHSLGGHALPLLQGVEHLDAAVTVGSQLPSFTRWPAGPARWAARAFFQLWVPGLVRLFGHLPAWALGGGLSLPGPAASDWSRWGRLPAYFLSDASLQPAVRADRFRGVAHCWAIDDDWAFAPAPAVQALADTLPTGRAEVLHLRRADVGLARIGHFGAFRRNAEARIWPLLLARIEAAVPALRA